MQGCKTNTIILAYSAYQGDHKLCKKRGKYVQTIESTSTNGTKKTS